MPNLLWNTGTGNNGQIASALTVLSTELNAVAANSYFTSSVGGSSGVFNVSNTGAAVRGHLLWTWGGAITPASPLAIPIWFLRSLDGTNFEPASALNARAPDAVMAWAASAYASGNLLMSQGPSIELPAVPFKVGGQNSAGATFPSSGTTLKIGFIAPAL